MKVVAVIALLFALCASAFAGGRSDKRMDKIRELYKKGDYEGVRTELLAAYDESPDPALLFALGQVELNLHNCKSAIGYYEKFIATSPDAEQVSLAQQGIGAARMCISEPERAPPPVTPLEPTLPEKTRQPDSGAEQPERPPSGRRWTVTHTGFVAFGGAAVLLGAGLLYYSHSLGSDQSGTLSAYDRRLGQARTMKWTGLGVAAAGTLIIGATFVW